MRSAHVLLVEDNPGDVDLIRDSFEECPCVSGIAVAADGQDAIHYLLRQGRHAQSQKPDLIILDLNLPRMSGHEMLAVVKQHEELRMIPVVVLTTSDAESDVRTSYALGANLYVTKPVDLKAFQSCVKSIETFWLSIAQLP